MFDDKEKRRYTVAIFIIMMLYLVSAYVLDTSVYVVIIGEICLLIGFVLTVALSKSMEKRISRVHKSIKKRFRDGERHVEELYDEGELSKLARTVDEIISELENMSEKQLREKKFLRDMMDDFSHQLKTPLASLTMFNDILIRDEEDNTVMNQRMNILRQNENQIERMTWIVQSMLKIARIESDSVDFARDRIDLLELSDECVSNVRHLALERNVDVVVEGESAFVFADEGWLVEAITNVIKNAIEASFESGEVRVTVNNTPMMAMVTITDYGYGIAEEERLAVFERFHRSNNDNYDIKPDSVGLGLALSKTIIEGCGGRIWIKSRHRSECTSEEKSYTEVHITFPVMQ